MSERKRVEAMAWVCPVPLRQYDRVLLGHGGGGKLSAELVEHLFVPAFGSAPEHGLHDSAVLEPGEGRLAFSTDSYVVRPLFFAGGSIGEIAVNGTVNDIAMSGGQPIALSCGFIIEEGLAMDTLGRVVELMAGAARTAGVSIATGDTKVVNRGAADQLFINTAGVGRIPDGVDIRPDRASPGDVVIVSGEIGVHGVAVMSEREGIEFGTRVRSDSAALNGLVGAMLDAYLDIHVLRDPTRGGVAASLCEIAAAAGVGIKFEESLLPVPAEVAAACSFLGLDPMNIANEGKLIAIVPPEGVDDVLNAMLSHEHGAGAMVIGTVNDEHPGVVTAVTRLGATRVVDLPLGEVLPRIC
ncbi:MAG: hydrogenase expression/formation protein HypE [Acidimicrobiales bacterium]|nr:hydrogenase expression/formation protein HypE [Acidimicrobiales bacterium]